MTNSWMHCRSSYHHPLWSLMMLPCNERSAKLLASRKPSSQPAMPLQQTTEVNKIKSSSLKSVDGCPLCTTTRTEAMDSDLFRSKFDHMSTYTMCRASSAVASSLKLPAIIDMDAFPIKVPSMQWMATLRKFLMGSEGATELILPVPLSDNHFFGQGSSS